jgi:hypothetical protein
MSRPSRARPVVRRLAFGLAFVAAAGVAVLAGGRHDLADAQGALFLDETFTGASAHPGFSAYGSACLTGAPEGTLSPGAHPLGGCPAAAEGPVPPIDGAPFGYLRLTDASQDQSAAVLFDTAVPASQGLRVRFEQWQYGSTTPAQRPADGIAFFLVDGQAELDAPGAFGGSLGYAQKLPDDDPTQAFLPGVAGGYLGIGLDYLGNFFGDWEHRGDGCPPEGRSPAGTGFRVPEADKITVRGPGDGTTGYCFITSTAANLDDPAATAWPSTLPVSLRPSPDIVSVSSDPQIAEQQLEPARRTIEVAITPAPDPVVTVSIAAGSGELIPVLQFPAPQPIPDSYKFGFSGSTGAFTDVHLIRNIVVESEQPSPLLTLAKSPSAPGPFQVGDTVTYTYEVTNTGLAPVVDLQIDDDKLESITCDNTTLAPVDQAPANTTTCRGTYTVQAADVTDGRVVNVATATGSGRTVVSPPAEATITVAPSTTTTAPASTTSTTTTSTISATPPGGPGGTGRLAATGPASPLRGQLILGGALLTIGVAAVLARRFHLLRRARPVHRR